MSAASAIRTLREAAAALDAAMVDGGTPTNDVLLAVAESLAAEEPRLKRIVEIHGDEAVWDVWGCTLGSMTMLHALVRMKQGSHRICVMWLLCDAIDGCLERRSEELEAAVADRGNVIPGPWIRRVGS